MKFLFTASILRHFLAFHLPVIEMLREQGHIVHIGAKNDLGDEKDSVVLLIDDFFDIGFERSPIRKKNIGAFRKLKRLIDEQHYDVIVCNTPMVGVLTRLAAINTRKHGTRVVYFAHGFHFYEGAPLLNWLIYYPIEWICSWFTDVLITINTEDYEFAKQHMHAKKIIYIPGVGIDLDKFKKNDISEDERRIKRQELVLKPGDKMLLSVGELNKNKNHEVVIRALAELKDEHIQYYIAGNGQLEEYLKVLADKLGVSEQVYLLGYRSDVKELLQIADLFVFPSHREGLSVSLMEAIACQVPVICSDIRGNRDLVIDGGLFNQKDIKDVANKITKFLATDNVEEVRLNYENLQKYRLDNVRNVMKKVYENA